MSPYLFHQPDLLRLRLHVVSWWIFLAVVALALFDEGCSAPSLSLECLWCQKLSCPCPHRITFCDFEWVSRTSLFNPSDPPLRSPFAALLQVARLAAELLPISPQSSSSRGSQLAMLFGFEFLMPGALAKWGQADPSLIVSINFELADFSLCPLFKFWI